MTPQQQQQQLQQNLEWVRDLLVHANAAKFFGELRIKIEDGKIVRAEQTQSMMPPARKI